MALDAAVLAAIREWTGAAPSDVALETLWLLDGYGTVETVALSVLRSRRADFLASPATFNVQGDASWSVGKNIDALDARIAELEALCGNGSGVLSAGQLVRLRGR